MSEESVQFIIGRAVVDLEFQELLFKDPHKALEGYDMTDRERDALKNLKREEFDAVSGEIEERISRAGLGVETFIKICAPQAFELKNVRLGDFYVRWVTDT